MKENSNNRDLIKTNLVFGGVKIFQMLVSLIKNKIVAVLLGPAGVGIQTLLVSTINTLHQFSSLGINQSSVREIAIEKEHTEKSKVIKVANILSVILGIIAAIICFVFSKQLSHFVFEKSDYTIMFQIVSVALFFESISNTQVAVLQGIRTVRTLAWASLVGSIISLLLSVPIYYYWRVDAIPFALILGYGSSALVYFIWRRKRIITKINIDKAEFKRVSAKILSLGITLMISSCIMTLLSMALNVFINRFGTSSDVGLYQAAYACTYSVVTVLVAILASDYYPRLSSMIDDKNKTEELINSQIELLELSLAPVVAIMCCFPEIVIKVLYSKEFLSVSYPVQLMGVALFFRILWHSLSYVILAYGDKKTYLFFDAIICNGLFFIGSMIGFYIGDIKGIGVSYLISSGLVMGILFTLVSLKYQIKISSVLIVFLFVAVALSIGIIELKQVLTDNRVIDFIISASIVLLASGYSLYRINSITGIAKIFIAKFRNRQ